MRLNRARAGTNRERVVRLRKTNEGCPPADSDSEFEGPPSKELAREGTVCGCDVDQHIAGFDAFGDFDEVYVANIGPHYAKMITRYGEDVIPAVRERRLARAS